MTEDFTFSSLLKEQNQMSRNSTFKEKAKSSFQMNPQQKNYCFRQQSRETHLQNIRKTTLFSLRAHQILEYLKSINYRMIESQQIINNAIKEQNLQQLFELITCADPQFRAAVLNQSQKIKHLIQSKIDKPEGIFLLANLCCHYDQFIKYASQRRFISKLMKDMSNMKGSNCNDAVSCYALALSKITFNPDLLLQDEIEECIPYIYSSLSWAFSSNSFTPKTSTLLIRVLLNISHLVTLSYDVLSFLMDLRLKRQVDIMNMFLIFDDQIKKMSFSEDSKARIKIIEYLIQIWEKIKDGQIIKTKNICLLKLLTILIQKSQVAVAEHIIQHRFKQTLGNYKYGNLNYYRMIYQTLMKISNIADPAFLQKVRISGMLDGIIFDITDANSLIGFQCVKIIKVFVMQLKSNSQIQYLEWILSLDLQRSLNQFLQSVNKGDDKVKNETISLLQMIFQYLR